MQPKITFPGTFFFLNNGQWLLVIAAESALGSVFQNITYTAIRHDRLLVNLSGESMRTLYNRYRGFPSDSRPVIMQAP